MTDPSKNAALAAADSADQAALEAEDGPSSSEPAAAERPSLLERVAALFRHRNGSSLRDEWPMHWLKAAKTARRFRRASGPCSTISCGCARCGSKTSWCRAPTSRRSRSTTTLGDLLNLFEQSGHSRMPVYAETLDDPRGMVHIRDVMSHMTRMARGVQAESADKPDRRAAPLDLAAVDLSRSIGELNLIRSVLFVPPSMLASDLMARMQATRTQMALVIDEYGGTDGLVSLEDIVEMVVGDIEDEHDDERADDHPDRRWRFRRRRQGRDRRGRRKMIGDDFTAGEHGEYVDTIGGMIFNTLGRVPARGEVVQAIPGFEFHVLDADPRRVKRVRIVQIRRANAAGGCARARPRPFRCRNVWTCAAGLIDLDR